MVKIYKIASLDAPALHAYRTLRQSAEHRRAGIFVAEGNKVVVRLFQSNLKVVSVLTTAELFTLYRKELDAREEPIDIFIGEKKLLETIVGFDLHQGIMAVGRIPEPGNVDSMVRNAAAPRLLVALDGITNAENLGVLVRNSAAFGVQGIIVGETSSSPYLRRSVRNSMGAVFEIPVAQSEDLVETLRRLREEYGVAIIGAHPGGSTALVDAGLRKDCCIVFGSEGDGLSERVLGTCDLAAAIPMRNGVDSLNVANASAVFLYEVMRQRGNM